MIPALVRVRLSRSGAHGNCITERAGGARALGTAPVAAGRVPAKSAGRGILICQPGRYQEHRKAEAQTASWQLPLRKTAPQHHLRSPTRASDRATGASSRSHRNCSGAGYGENQKRAGDDQDDEPRYGPRQQSANHFR